MNEILYKVENAYLYTLRWDGKAICVRIVGYYYDAGFSQENDDRDWRYVGFSGYDMPLTEFLNHKIGDLERWEEQYTRWIEDCSEDEILAYLTSECAPIPRLINDVTEDDINDNVYIDLYL